MLLGDLSLDAAPATGALDKLESKMGGTTAALGGLSGVLGELATGPIGALTAAIGTAAGIIEGFKSAMDLGQELNDLSLRTGESAGSLTILREAFSEAGLGADGAERYLMRMQKSLSGMNEDGEDASKVFNTLGVSIDDLKGLDAIGQIQALQKGFAGITDQATKASVARDLFGKGGGKALSLLSDPQVLEDARRRAGPLADVMDRNAGSIDKLSDVMGALKLNFQEFFEGALSKIAPEATTIADALGDIDFVGIGEGVGSLASIVLKLGEAFVFIAPAINWVSEMLSKGFGSGSTADAGLAAKYRGFAKLAADSSGSGGDSSPVGTLQKVGLGGGFGGGDPLLSEAQRTNSILARIEQKLTPSRPSASGFQGPPV